MKPGDLRRYDPPYEGTEFKELLLKVNMRRNLYAAIVLLLVQVLNVLTHLGSMSWLMLAGNMLMSIGCLAYLAWSAVCVQRAEPPQAQGVWMCRLLWLFICIGMMPYCQLEFQAYMATGKVAPLNYALLCAMLIIFPIFTRQEILFYAGLTMVGNLLLAYGAKASPEYYVFIVLLAALSMALSYLVQYKTLREGWKYLDDGRKDELTGLLNRKGAAERMQMMQGLCVRQGIPCAVFMVDVDKFKEYNDGYGHIQGDVALRMVAQTLGAVFTRQTDIVCRFGGEEFVVCCALQEQEAWKMGEKMLAAVRALKLEMPGPGGQQYLTVSVGCTLYDPLKDDKRCDITQMIEVADKAMYQAKTSGGNHQVVA